MKPRKDLVGQSFGDLTVTSYTGKSKWEYLCTCGRKAVINGKYLKSSAQYQCKNCSYENRAVQMIDNPAGDIPREMWSSMRRNAASRSLEVAISPIQAHEIYIAQDGKCALSGVEIAFRDQSKRKSSASLDRIDSQKDYVTGNIQWLHKIVNRMKVDLPEAEFINWCAKIARNCQNPTA